MSNLTLSNLTYSNQEYIVLGSNANGVLTIAQPTTTSYFMQISKFVPSTFTNDYTCSIADSTSNITVGLKGSNLQVYNKSSNLFINSIPSSYFLPSLYNTLALNRYDNSLLISINNSNIVRISSSNELPFTFENSKIVVTASNGLKFKDITYQPVGVTNTAMNFTKPVKALTIHASNITACNLLILGSNIMSACNISVYGSNTSVWSSNNLLNKNTSGTVTGSLTITSNALIGNAQIGEIVGYGNQWAGFAHSNQFAVGKYALLQNSVTGQTLLNCATGADIRFRINNGEQGLWNTTGLGVGTTAPAHRLDVAGNINATGSIISPTISALSNLGMSGSNTAVWSSNTATSLSNTYYTSTTGSTATYASNTATWSSNNNINRITDSIATLTTSNITIRGTGVNPLCLVLSNLNNPGMVLYSSNASLEVAVSSITGGYSADALAGDGIIRFSSNLYIQQGPFSSAICVNSNNNVGIRTKSPAYSLHVAGSFFCSNITSPTITSLSNAVVFSSNQCAALCNLANDAWTRATFSSNNFGQFIGSNDGVYSIWYNRNISNPSSNYAIKQHYNGFTVINGSSNEGVMICEGDDFTNATASFLNNKMSIGGGAPYPLYTLDVQGDARMTDSLTLKRGLDASAGTFTHLPFSGDLKNYIRGTTVICDNGGSVGVGTSTPSALLDVAGLTRTTNFKIGSGGSTIKFLWLGSVTVGTSVGQKKTVTASFPTGSQPSNSNYLVYLDYQSANDDIFVGKIRNKSSTSFDLVTYRADGTSWGTSVDCTLMVVGY